MEWGPCHRLFSFYTPCAPWEAEVTTIPIPKRNYCNFLQSNCVESQSPRLSLRQTKMRTPPLWIVWKSLKDNSLFHTYFHNYLTWLSDKEKKGRIWKQQTINQNMPPINKILSKLLNSLHSLLVPVFFCSPVNCQPQRHANIFFMFHFPQISLPPTEHKAQESRTRLTLSSTVVYFHFPFTWNQVLSTIYYSNTCIYI